MGRVSRLAREAFDQAADSAIKKPAAWCGVFQTDCLSGRRRFYAKVFARGENLGAGAALPTPSIQIPKGGSALWAAEPKTKGHCNSMGNTAFRLTPKTKSKPSAAGSIWKGGARERADDVFFAIGIKRRRSKADFAPTWYRWWGSNPHGVTTGGF